MVFAALVGFLLGFLGSIPVAGPIAVLVFVHGVSGRFRSGLNLALGAAVAESAYACLAFWGFSSLLARYELVIPLSRAIAAVILIALGVVLMRRKALAAAVGPAHAGGSFLVGFSITALNPTLIATWSAAMTVVFSTGYVSFPPWSEIPFSIGALVGISGWFGLLLWLLRRYRDRFRAETLNRLIRIMGVVLVVLGVGFAVQLVQYLVKL